MRTSRLKTPVERQVLMDWIVRIRDQRDNRGFERRYVAALDFNSGVKERLENGRQRIMSATLPSGVIPDEEKLRQPISTGPSPVRLTTRP
jgi:hypothetical protein